MDLAAFEGRWHLSRVIDDQHAGLTGHLLGEALWSRDDEGLIQTETGTLTYGNAAPMQATRRYLWRMVGDVVQVLFEDARPFHIVPTGGREAVHDCPPDIYRVRYAFERPDQFTTIWQVTGPRKDAVLTSTFSRL